MLGEQYKKESDGKTYMLLPKGKETFEELMIRNTMPEGVLAMAKSESEGSYKYEITGKKTLTMTFERIPMNAEQIEAVLRGIMDVLERGREFLLSEENFVLLPEYIFLRIPTYEVTLCYYPEYGIPFVEQMGKLFEMLLNRVDYREEKAIEMVYALYMQLQEPDMTAGQLRERLSMQTGKSTECRKTLRTTANEKAAEPGYPSVRSRADESAVSRELPKKEAKQTGFFERIRKEVISKIQRAAELSGREMSGREPETLLPSYPGPCVMESPPEWGNRYTTVLSVKKKEEPPSLVSKKTGETVFLTKFPFYVGSLANYMDYVIKEETVSRFHGKFIKKGEEIYLTDLNSTNGTQVNGQVLMVQEQVKLKEGDRVLFADAEYTFFAGEKTAM